MSMEPVPACHLYKITYELQVTSAEMIALVQAAKARGIDEGDELASVRKMTEEIVNRAVKILIDLKAIEDARGGPPPVPRQGYA